MTTNVFDGVGGVVAADVRWSTLATDTKWMIYLDEPNYSKLVLKNNLAFLFAGDGLAIQAWKDWLKIAPIAARPSANNMAISIIDLGKSELVYHENQNHVTGEIFTASGTGSFFALSCWTTNKCAKKAIASASIYDIHTSNYVQFYEIKTKVHNLPDENHMTINDVCRTMAVKGFVMNKELGKDSAFALSAISSNGLSPEDLAQIETLKNGLANAQIAPTAPCDEIFSVRTEEQEIALDQALSKVFNQVISRA